MKFDVVIMNPPYQRSDANKGANNILWDKFFSKSVSVVKNEGHVCAIHPSDWRSPSSVRLRLKKCFQDILVKYLEIHGFKDGIKTFKCNTRYDWHISQKRNPKGKTIVVFEDGEKQTIKDIYSWPFIPNSNLKIIRKLIADKNEDRIRIIHDSSYHTHNYGSKVSKIKSITNKYPCVYSVNKNDVAKFRWSNFNDNGHFGISKVIFGNGATGFIADKNGKYGMTEYCTGIVCDKNEAELIIRALKSEKFHEVMGSIQTGFASINHNVIKYFRKDFWKEFI